MDIITVVLEPIAANQLKIYYQNYLEIGTISVTSENSSYPKYRLYDRAQGLLFKGNSLVDICTGGTPSADSTFSGRPASCAFDADPATYWNSGNSIPLPHWLLYQLAVAKVARGYKIRIRSDITDQAPKDFKLQGSNGAGWTDLDTRTGITWSVGEEKSFSISGNDTAYLYYRLYITTTDSGTYASVAKMQIFEGLFDVGLDLGSTGPYPLIDTLILGKNHNLQDLAIELGAGANGVDYDPVDSWTPTAGINRRPFTGLNRRYWRFRIKNLVSPAEIGELFLTKQLLFERNPNYGYGYGDDKNSNRLVSKSKMTQKTKWGEKTKGRSYELTNMTGVQRGDLEAFDAETEAIKNFYVEDLEGNLFFAEMPTGLPRFKAEKVGRWSIDLEVLEVLD